MKNEIINEIMFIIYLNRCWPMWKRLVKQHEKGYDDWENRESFRRYFNTFCEISKKEEVIELQESAEEIYSICKKTNNT